MVSAVTYHLPFTSYHSRLPVNRSLFRRIDVRDLNSFVEEEDVHLVEEELVRIWVRNIEAEVVDELFLFLLPLGPAALADLSPDLLSELSRDRSIAQRVTLATAPRAFEFVTE